MVMLRAAVADGGGWSQLWREKKHKKEVRCCLFTADGGTLATLSTDALLLWPVTAAGAHRGGPPRAVAPPAFTLFKALGGGSVRGAAAAASRHRAGVAVRGDRRGGRRHAAALRGDQPRGRPRLLARIPLGGGAATATVQAREVARRRSPRSTSRRRRAAASWRSARTRARRSCSTARRSHRSRACRWRVTSGCRSMTFPPDRRHRPRRVRRATLARLRAALRRRPPPPLRQRLLAVALVLVAVVALLLAWMMGGARRRRRRRWRRWRRPGEASGRGGVKRARCAGMAELVIIYLRDKMSLHP